MDPTTARLMDPNTARLMDPNTARLMKTRVNPASLPMDVRKTLINDQFGLINDQFGIINDRFGHGWTSGLAWLDLRFGMAGPQVMAGRARPRIPVPG